MKTIKAWLNSWIFWLVISIIIFGIFVYLLSTWGTDDNRMFLVMLLLEGAIIMFLFSISHKTGVKIPLTILIAGFSILGLSLVLHFLYIDSDILEEIFVPLALSVIVPTTIVTLLKLVRKK